jgi:hypothetical protein
MIKNIEEKSDYILYIERTPEQKMANLANVLIEDKSNSNTIISKYQDIIFNPHNECKLKAPTIQINDYFYGHCVGCKILCSNAKESKPLVIPDKTDEYINKYITTEFNKEYDINDTYFDLSGGLISSFPDGTLNWDKIANVIKQLSYEKFLLTYYWDIIKQYLRQEAKGRCRICNSGGMLHVHHRNYDIRGYEAQNLNELIVLCEDCHKIFHKKMPQIK